MQETKENEFTYEEFINNILETRGRFVCGEEYHERHHIIARCMGGTDEEDNLIDLFAREHFEAHRLLALENPDVQGLTYAWWCMCQCPGSSKKRDEVTPEEYENARIAFVQSISGENNYFYGKHHSDESKKKNSEWHKENMSGKNNPFYGKYHTKESRKKNSLAHKGKESPRKGIKMSEDFCRHNSEVHKGQKAWNKGVPMSEEQKQKLSLIMTGKPSAQRKSVVCINTQRVYISATDASIQTDININCIVAACQGKRKSAGGYHWKYLYDQTRKDGTVIQGAISLGLITEEEALKQLNNDTE